MSSSTLRIALRRSIDDFVMRSDGAAQPYKVQNIEAKL